MLEGVPPNKPTVTEDDEWDSDFPDDEELEEILRSANLENKADSEGPVDDTVDSDATDIEENDRGEALGYDSDRSDEEPETAEDRQFIDHDESRDTTTSHAALLQQKKEEDENAWLQR